MRWASATMLVTTGGLLVSSCGASGGATSHPVTAHRTSRPVVRRPVVRRPVVRRRIAEPQPATRNRSILAFRGVVTRVSPALQQRLTSWHAGCPVAIADLRVLSVSYWGFDHSVHIGHLMVNRDATAPVLYVLRRLFATRFPIRRMRLVEAYGSDDERSMAADNTSGFNCRLVPGSSTWSQHAYGRAIDVNPLENPEVQAGVISPPAGRAYADRSRQSPGMIHTDDRVVRAFAEVGWGWGGAWGSLKDYQHFSATGT
jgi:D-alanyl-D-alanine carboxypeptidase